jgi:hypothetical protein
LVDIGRKINLEAVISLVPGIKDKSIIKSRNTPSYLDFPEPVRLEIDEKVQCTSEFVNEIDLRVKLYEDGVISLISRLHFDNLPFNKLHIMRKLRFSIKEDEFDVNQFLKFQQNKLLEQIKESIEEPGYKIGIMEMEKYTVYCIQEKIDDPQDFIEKNRNYIANLLIGESPELNLNKHQVEQTLENSFAYLQNEYVIFDFDHCLIIDPNNEYDDILLIIEIANYQLLELRTLDKLLDRRISLAEEDISKIYFKNRALWNRLKKRVGNLMRLRYDLTFLLENVENVSKLIGDYYLAQLYTNLSYLFQLKQWSQSIRHRLETLGDIYNIAQSSRNERFLLYLEILLSIVFIMEFLFLILDFYIN